MQITRKQQKVLSPMVTSVSGLLAMLVLMLSFASVSPLVHEKLHCGEVHNECSSPPSNSEDAPDDAGHFCAVNWLAGGVLLVEAVAVPGGDYLNRLGMQVESEQRSGERGYLFSEARAPPVELI